MRSTSTKGYWVGIWRISDAMSMDSAADALIARAI
jgi:hypothetical protein